MIAKIVSFTDEGKKVENLLKEKIPEIVWRQKSESENLREWTADAFSKRIPLVFVSAAGIAVRTVAPFVKDKLSDSPVVVVDEKCGFAVPVLSGHFGGSGTNVHKKHYKSAENHYALFNKENKENPAESVDSGVFRFSEADEQYDCYRYLSELIGNGIKNFSKGADLVESARNFSVKKIRKTRNSKNCYCQKLIAVEIHHGKYGYMRNTDNRKKIRYCKTAFK